MRAAVPVSFPSPITALISNLLPNALLLWIYCAGRDRGGFLHSPSYQKDPYPISQGTNVRNLLRRFLTLMHSRQSFHWEPGTDTRGGPLDFLPVYSYPGKRQQVSLGKCWRMTYSIYLKWHHRILLRGDPIPPSVAHGFVDLPGGHRRGTGVFHCGCCRQPSACRCSVPRHYKN